MLWYHISNEFIGYNPILEPRVPIVTETTLTSEGNIPRVCVSNSIYFCIRSKVGREDLRVCDVLDQFSVAEDNENYIIETKNCKISTVKNTSVYVTEDTPYYPPDYSDFRRNNEMWFITPTQFHFIGFLSIGEMVKNQVVRFSSQQIETIYFPKDFEMNLELNPFMDPLYTNNKFFYQTHISKKYKIEQGMIPIYMHDYGYEGFTEENAKERLKCIGILK